MVAASPMAKMEPPEPMTWFWFEFSWMGERERERKEVSFFSVFFLRKKTLLLSYLQPRRRHHRPEVRLRPRRQLGLQLLHQRVHRHPGGPDAGPERDLGLFAVGAFHFHKAFAGALAADLEDARVQNQLDSRALELLVGVLGDGAVVGGEEVVLELDDAHAAVLDDL
jgi:hypothetical protein